MKHWKYIFGTLTLVLAMIVIAVSQLPDGNLHIIACNVGQGDAILITYGNTQILTDGGPDKTVMNCLGKYMPFWDRTIELVISTHPDADHSTGLVEVLKNYKVGQILINPIDPGTQVYKALENEIGTRGVRVVNPVQGMSIGVGLIHLDIENPSRELVDQISDFKSGETNLYSIVYLLTYGQFRGLFTGDMPPSVSDGLAAGQLIGTVDYIKIPHHGSNNGLTENLLKAVMPKIAVISVGKNSWGFPKNELMDMLNRYSVKVYRTDKMGDVEVVTDGAKYWIGK
jgi:competence protein ComEC